MKYFSAVLIGSLILFIEACVPKAEYEDQQSKLIETQTKLRSLQASSSDCDKDLFLQLKEQAESLDLLTQELVERNTELSKEVARLKVVESQSKGEDQICDRKMSAQATENDGKLERTRATYEDLLRQQKGEIARLKESLEKKSEPAPKPKPKASAPKKPTESPKPKK